MIDRITLKNNAQQQIKGNIAALVAGYIIAAAMMVVLIFIPIVGVFALFILEPAFYISMVMMFLGQARGVMSKAADIFAAFKNTTLLVNSVLTTILIGVFTSLWSLLLVVPGIIKALSYSMAYYILAENPDIGALGAIGESKRIMEGHKMELFILQLSFIPWMLLTAVTFGIAGIYAMPYMQQTLANFYLALKNGGTRAEQS
ncbi:MAG: DUF975 family protein [Oscillospiraceae bacterium]|jgi:uncharacterized membrane protein|nr:DUF975 family protein [Oscillospiraceae bacterium]